MAERLLNNFLIGADPELVLLDPPKLVKGDEVEMPFGARGPHTFYGFDHGGYVLEPHPTPALSAREVCHNLKRSMAVAAFHFPNFRHRSGAYYSDPDVRSVTLGGHVHLDLKTLSPDQIGAMDTLKMNFEHLDILPATECAQRAVYSQYGRTGDVRTEHGHVEYRSLCSWLFSRKTSMLCLTSIKLAAIAPETVKIVQSSKALLNWLETFKGTDDDVDWILNKDYFAESLVAKPDADVLKVWKIEPTMGKEHWEKLVEARPVPPPVFQRPTLPDRLALLKRNLDQKQIRLRELAAARAERVFRVLPTRTVNDSIRSCERVIQSIQDRITSIERLIANQ